MLLGTRNYAIADVRKITINYHDWLVEGYILSSVTANITPTVGITSTVGAVAFSPDEETAYITLNCGSVSESFTLNVIAKDSFGQTVNDALNINILAPGAF